MKNPANKGGADRGSHRDHLCFTNNSHFCPLPDDLASYRALTLIAMGVRPELATMLAALAFGGCSS